MQRSSATDPSGALIAALADRDFTQLAGTLSPDARMRALIPPGPVEVSGAEEVAARFASWFGSAEEFDLVGSGSDEVGDRLHVFYRFRARRPGELPTTIEQHLFCTHHNGRVLAFDLVCSGFRPDPDALQADKVVSF